MPLPSDFCWTTRSASLPDDAPTVIACSGVWMVVLMQRVNDGVWIASLDRHRHGPGGPFRWCTSYEQGRAGAEMWVTRHETRLREDVAKIKAYRDAVRRTGWPGCTSSRPSAGRGRRLPAFAQPTGCSSCSELLRGLFTARLMRYACKAGA